MVFIIIDVHLFIRVRAYVCVFTSLHERWWVCIHTTKWTHLEIYYKHSCGDFV